MFSFCHFHLTGPPKVEGVTFGNNTVKNGTIQQEIEWKAPEFRHNKFQKYKIKYGVTLRVCLSKDNRCTFSSESHTTLQLNFNTSNITYYVQVAVRSTQNNFTGDFSDPVSITYTSEFIRTQFVY